MDSQQRAGEESALPFRSSRLFHVDNKWYFTTREGTIEGPYAQKFKAEEALQAYIAIIEFNLIDEETSRQFKPQPLESME